MSREVELADHVADEQHDRRRAARGEGSADDRCARNDDGLEEEAVANASTGSGGGELAIQWYSASTCTGFITNAQTPTAIVPGDATNVWHSLDANSIAPAGAASVLVIAAVLNNSGEGNTFSMNYDEVYFQTTPRVAAIVPAGGLPALIVLGLALAATGVIRFSRIT